MTKQKNVLFIIAVCSVFSMLLAIPAFAISDNAGGNSDNSNSSSQGSDQTDQGNQSDNSSQSDQAQSSSSGKLDDNKKKICQQNENRIRNMFTNMNQLGEGQLNLFDNIAEKVQKFYVDNKLDIENYDQLVQEIEQTKLAAQNAVRTATQTSSKFGCDADDPKGTTNEFKVQVKAQVKELKAYKLAIKNLISAIQDAADNTSEEQ